MIKTISFITSIDEPYKGTPVRIKQKLGQEESACIASAISTSLDSFFRRSIYPLPLPKILLSNIGDSLVLTMAERDEASALGINFFIYNRGVLAFVWNSLGIPGLGVQETISLARIYRKILKIYEQVAVYDAREFNRIKREVRFNISQLLEDEIKNCATLRYRIEDGDVLEFIISCNEFESPITFSQTTFSVGSNLKELSDIFWDSWKPE